MKKIITKMEKINKLTPIKKLDKKDKCNRYVWLFECDCGNFLEFPASIIKRGKKIDCGCGKEERLNTRIDKLSIGNTLPDNLGNYNKLYGAYKRGATRRGYKFFLKKEEFIELLNGNCYYCGSKPSSKYTNSRIGNNILIYNGIDRKNNLLDYTTDNCITACGVCNRMKMDRDIEHFITKIKDIYEKLCIVPRNIKPIPQIA